MVLNVRLPLQDLIPGSPPPVMLSLQDFALTRLASEQAPDPSKVKARLHALITLGFGSESHAVPARLNHLDACVEAFLPTGGTFAERLALRKANLVKIPDLQQRVAAIGRSGDLSKVLVHMSLKTELIAEQRALDSTSSALHASIENAGRALKNLQRVLRKLEEHGGYDQKSHAALHTELEVLHDQTRSPAWRQAYIDLAQADPQDAEVKKRLERFRGVRARFDELLTSSLASQGEELVRVRARGLLSRLAETGFFSLSEQREPAPALRTFLESPSGVLLRWLRASLESGKQAVTEREAHERQVEQRLRDGSWSVDQLTRDLLGLLSEEYVLPSDVLLLNNSAKTEDAPPPPAPERSAEEMAQLRETLEQLLKLPGSLDALIASTTLATVETRVRELSAALPTDQALALEVFRHAPGLLSAELAGSQFRNYVKRLGRAWTETQRYRSARVLDVGHFAGVDALRQVRAALPVLVAIDAILDAPVARESPAASVSGPSAEFIRERDQVLALLSAELGSRDARLALLVAHCGLFGHGEYQVGHNPAALIRRRLRGHIGKSDRTLSDGEIRRILRKIGSGDDTQIVKQRDVDSFAWNKDASKITSPAQRALHAFMLKYSPQGVKYDLVGEE